MRLIATLLLLAASSAWGATQVPDGKWRFQFVDNKGRADRPIEVFTYRPRRCDSRCPMVFLMAGAKREASNYLRHWETIADVQQLILVAPAFQPKAWPRAAGYNFGDVAGQPDREKWAFSAIEHLFDALRDGQEGYTIFGHGAGAQFVQRMAILRPDNRATVMVAANPGFYAMPEWRKEKGAEPYPYSLLGSPVADTELRRALAKRFILMVGERDDDPDEEGLGKGAAAMKQGEGRVERGENFIKAATAAAAELGVPLKWEMHEIPDTAHDGEAISRAAARILYGKK
ncbi:MAG TPA: hypothetical protein VM122_05120 [Usitatibacter sp.]|nr:hypothetical protein [Usitatibacter sp.]